MALALSLSDVAPSDAVLQTVPAAARIPATFAAWASSASSANVGTI
jgi:hypothetical protein